MNIEVNGKLIETDTEGYLLNPGDWDEDVMLALIKQHEADGHKPLSDTAIGLVEYARDYYKEHQKHPTMNKLIKELGERHKGKFSEAEEYKQFLYGMFPHGPIQKLCKLAGLHNPGNENQG